MPNESLKGVKVNGVEYHFDHDYLDNDPLDATHAQTSAEVEDEVLVYRSGDQLQWKTVFPTNGNVGDVLTINDDYEPEWQSVGSGGSGGESEIPHYEDFTEDNVLVANGSGLQWLHPDEVSSSYQHVPLAGCDWGTILMCREDFTDGVGWANIKDALPSFDESDEGKVLMIQDGEIAWGNPS